MGYDSIFNCDACPADSVATLLLDGSTNPGCFDHANQERSYSNATVIAAGPRDEDEDEPDEDGDAKFTEDAEEELDDDDFDDDDFDDDDDDDDDDVDDDFLDDDDDDF